MVHAPFFAASYLIQLSDPYRKQLKIGQASILTHAIAARGSEAEPQTEAQELIKTFPTMSAFLAQDDRKRASYAFFTEILGAEAIHVPGSILC